MLGIKNSISNRQTPFILQKREKMKPNLLTSISLGLLLPWLYFIVVNVGPTRFIDSKGNTTFGQTGISGFIEFFGIWNSISIYLQATVVCTLFVYCICVIYSYFVKN